MRNRSIIVLVLSLLLILAGGAGARAWRLHREKALAREAVPPRPDTRRWSKEFIVRVDRASEEVQQAKNPRRALGELARLYQVNGYAAEAARLLRALIKLEPDNPRWTYYLADLQLKVNANDEAIALLRRTTQLAPDYTPALIALGDFLIGQKQYAEARSCFESCLVFAPNDPRPATNLAYLDSIAGNLRGALQRLDPVLRNVPNYGAGHRLKAELLAKAGDRAGAAEEQRRERLCPPFAPVDPWLDELNADCYDPYRLQMAAAVYTRGDRTAEALPFLRRSLQLAPDEATFYDTLSEACAMVGRLDEARETLARGVEAAPDSFALPVHLAVVLCRLQRTDEALTVIDRAVRKWPTQAEVLAARGHTLLLARRPAEAVEAFQAALVRNPSLPEAHYNLGRALLELEKAEKARSHFEEALQIRPDYADAMISLATLAIDTGELEAAERHAAKLFAQSPDLPKARRLYGDVQHLKANALAGEGKMEEAEKAYQAGLAASPEIPLLHAGLGMVYVAKGRPDLALPELRRYLQMAPEDFKAYVILGDTLKTLGQGPEARQVLDQGLALARKSEAKEVAEEFEALLKQL